MFIDHFVLVVEQTFLVDLFVDGCVGDIKPFQKGRPNVDQL